MVMGGGWSWGPHHGGSLGRWCWLRARSCTGNPELEHVPMDPVEEELEDVLMKM